MPSQHLSDLLFASSDKPLFIINSKFDIIKSNGKLPNSFIEYDDVKSVVKEAFDSNQELINQEITIRSTIISEKYLVDLYPTNIAEVPHILIKVQNSNETSIEHKNVEQQILNEIAESFTTNKRGKQFFDFILKEVVYKTNSDYGIIAEILHNDYNDNLSCIGFAKDGELVDHYKNVKNSIFYKQILNGETAVHLENARRDFNEDATVNDLEIEGFICQPLRDGNGGAIGLLCTMQKSVITESEYIISVLKVAAKRCEMELHLQRCEKLVEQKNFELKRQSKDMASFTYIASHDLQEPLRKIRMFNSRILEKDADTLSERALGYFNSINSTADRMQNLINALLSYSSMDSDDLSTERISLNKILKEVLTMMGDMLEGKDVTINADKLPTVQVIRTQFQQLLYNLLSNAVKYAKADVPSKISITAKKELVGRQNFWRIDISDNGIGFDPQYKEKIFEVFQRLHGKQEYAGTGVGLAICSKVAKNHHGYITADGVPNEGATFSIFLPIK